MGNIGPYFRPCLLGRRGAEGGGNGGGGEAEELGG
jgi:hypothetical protein